MKRLLLFCSLLWQCALFGQQTATNPIPSSDRSFQEGYQYLNGTGKPLNPVKAFQLFRQDAAAGGAKSWNALGNMYANGIVVDANTDSALLCYKTAAAKGYGPAFNNLGRLYQVGALVKQDFAAAANYYAQGASLGNDACKSWLAYLNYKGLGVPQNYSIAFSLYTDLAQRGNRNAMYFLGKCYRNGYGVEADAALAKSWFMKSAAAGEGQAEHELTAEPLPDNALIYDPGLQARVQALEGDNENFVAASTNDLSGVYKGYAVYYDFSRKFVLEIVPLTLDINQNRNGYQGTWTEGDTLKAPISATFYNNRFSFDSSSQYTRHNHYSNRSPELYRFNEAALTIKYLGDSLFLSGNVQFYSVSRKEPGEPMYIALSRKEDRALVPSSSSSLHLSLSPNPTNGVLTVEFSLNSSQKVQLEILSVDGRPLQQTTVETLPVGSYTHAFSVQGYAAGSYFLRLIAGNTTESKTFIKL